MRKFRLLTDGEYVGCVKDQVFYECEKISDTGRTVNYYQEMYPEDWQEVFETEPKTLHKETDLGYFAGLAMQSLIHNKYLDKEETISTSIELAKELIKQLDSLHDTAPNHNE